MRHFRVIADGVVSLLHSRGEVVSPNGEVLGYDHESVLRFPDNVLSEEDMSPVVVDAYDAEDEHTRKILVECDEEGRVGEEKPVPLERRGGRRKKAEPVEDGELPPPLEPPAAGDEEDK